MNQTYKPYYRVSTKGQGQLGQSLESQQVTVANYVKDQNAVLAEFSDIESGKMIGLN